MRRQFTSIAILVIAGCSTTTTAPDTSSTSAATANQSAAEFEAPDHVLKAEIDPIIDSALTQGFAGQVSIMRDGAYVYNRAAGTADLGGEIPVTNSTLFHVASITKYLTASLILKASDDGLIDLDAPIAPFAPGTALADRLITPRDLLAHRSGLGSSYVAESLSDAHEAIAAIARAGFDEEKVGAFRYSNDGYDLLGIILEMAYEQPYEVIAAEFLADTDSIKQFGFWAEVDLADAHVVGQPLRPVSEDLGERNYGMLGSSGLLITAKDLVAWQHALVAHNILSATSIAELTKPRGQMSIGQATYGAFIVDSPLMGRGLRALGYEDWGDNAMLAHYKNCGFIVAVTTSRGPGESTGKPPFRSSIIEEVEQVLSQRCELTAQ